MLDPELLSSLLTMVLARGGEYADIFVESRRTTLVSLEDRRIERVISGVDSGAGIRLISGSSTAYAFTNDLSRKSLSALCSALSEAFRKSRGLICLDLRRAKPPLDFMIERPPQSVPIERKVVLVAMADGTARDYDQRIRQVTVTYRDSLQRVQIANSEGSVAEDERAHTVCAVHVTASDDRVIQTGYEAEGGTIGFELFDTVSVEELAHRAAERAVKMLAARRAPAGRMPIVLSSSAGGTMIHEAVGHGLEADLARQGLSVYTDRIGQEVASPLVTVIDDPTLPNKRGSFRFDDEGTPSQRTVLVEKGVLRGYLYDRLTAMRHGEISTGNGRRESYRHRPIPRMTNTFIAPGDRDPKEVLRSTPAGLFVRKMGGGQVNTVNGDFVFGVQEGYIIEHGAIGEPVRGATLTGSCLEVLKSIDMVGSDLGFSIGTCGKDSQGVPISDAMPTIRVAEMVVGGKVKL